MSCYIKCHILCRGKSLLFLTACFWSILLGFFSPKKNHYSVTDSISGIYLLHSFELLREIIKILFMLKIKLKLYVWITVIKFEYLSFIYSTLSIISHYLAVNICVFLIICTNKMAFERLRKIIMIARFLKVRLS